MLCTSVSQAEGEDNHTPTSKRDSVSRHLQNVSGLSAVVGCAAKLFIQTGRRGGGVGGRQIPEHLTRLEM